MAADLSSTSGRTTLRPPPACRRCSRSRVLERSGMKDLTVSQLAAISGVTVRTLHHYDEIGLLRPACVGANGYRYYGQPEQLRLQRILFHRELGVPLTAIAGLLELEGEDQIAVLAQHRDKLEEERERY